MSIERIEKKLDRLMAHLGVGETSVGKADAHEGDVATDDDLDGPYGNPELRIPRSEKWVKWADYNGRTMSDAPTDLLRQYARLLEWQANKDEAENKVSKSGKPTAGYKRQDAARARGWAQRNQRLARPAPVDFTARLPVSATKSAERPAVVLFDGAALAEFREHEDDSDIPF